VAISIARHMRQRCRAMRCMPNTPPRRIMLEERVGAMVRGRWLQGCDSPSPVTQSRRKKLEWTQRFGSLTAPEFNAML
jgi:hypothetical protein